MASIVNSSASDPDVLQVGVPMAPVSVGVADVHAVFSSVEALARPPIVSVEVSAESVTITSIEAVAVFSSSSVTFTVTS